MSYFMQNGDAFIPTSGKESVFEELPVGNYVVAKSMSGLYFQRVDRFEPAGKMYGNVHQRAERVLQTFESRPRTTGVLYAGEKGSGKSQEARIISEKGYALGMPTILVNQPWCGDEFNALLASVENPAIVLMDEFEKVYPDDHQEKILTLLDGAMTSKKLFILTVNDKWKVSSHMKNRPGRLYYLIDFDGLEPEFVREYCVDVLKNQKYTEDVIKVGALFSAFNFDVLKALVEEMNRYDEDPYQAMELLNANPMTVSTADVFDVVVTRDGAKLKCYNGKHTGHPMSPARRDGLIGQFMVKDKKAKGADEDGDIYILASSQDLKTVDADAGVYVFENEDGYVMTFTRQPKQTVNYRAY